ncbi:hypothetical protein AGABI2DRAFT_121305 [Agaricus bisporus var. bisporus H97]|uniref:hypothetical protein n=1 Tax=Agaricus bisporus var. bisporus (strain H97 / ATCC MYA-4626 / FGSC 10389) TaxID=936046 RepID=UPI00029F78D1|nr:hypothetical protein AGABI2DRAFT_121305 [Agaricus bisporus var. bisporus H97]EKV44120.1 hypothetical protein AGABI2DRAFT_121305 [Agaricus bisporus var. bisporus H97]
MPDSPPQRLLLWKSEFGAADPEQVLDPEQVYRQNNTGNEEIVEDNGIEEGHSDNIITHDSDYFEGGQKKDELIMRNREDDERSLQHRDDKHGEIKNDSGCIEAEEEKRKGVKEVLTAAEGEREGCGKGVKEVLTAPEGEREGREDIRNNGEIRSDTGRAEAKEEKGKRKRDKEVLIAAEGETERREDVLVTVEGKNQEKKERDVKVELMKDTDATKFLIEFEISPHLPYAPEDLSDDDDDKLGRPSDDEVERSDEEGDEDGEGSEGGEGGEDSEDGEGDNDKEGDSGNGEVNNGEFHDVNSHDDNTTFIFE